MQIPATENPLAERSAAFDALYPLRLEPIYQYRLWGGRRLATVVGAALPDGPVGEAWLLSDRDDHCSVIANGPLKGCTIGQLLEERPEELLGSWTGRLQPAGPRQESPNPQESANGQDSFNGRAPARSHRFPLLLKFLDVRGALSVQVHPSDQQTAYLPAGESGKTEGWVVLETGSDSRIFAGLEPNTTKATVREALANGSVADRLAAFTPQAGDAVLIPAGTVHSLRDLVVFEVQENSDVTFRLYDWNHVDARTQRPRPLQVEEAMACIDFAQGARSAVTPVVETRVPLLREKLFDCEHFRLWRLTAESTFAVGSAGSLRVLVCISGEGHLRHDGAEYPCAPGDVQILPAAMGPCLCQPHGSICLLEIALPQSV